eukprot:m.116076 g.116076  ORF g.116076 m.116076 type:complete len:63 (-) comp21614_c0_seq1:2403-2591(-)
MRDGTPQFIHSARGVAKSYDGDYGNETAWVDAVWNCVILHTSFQSAVLAAHTVTLSLGTPTT